MQTQHRTTARRTISHTALLCVLLGAVTTVAKSADETGLAIDNTRDTLARWVEARKLISQEKRDWQLSREMLSERIALVQREIDQMRRNIETAEANITELDKQRAQRLEESEALKAASATLAEIVHEFEQRTLDLLARLPDPIRDRVKPLSQRIPQPPAETRLSLGERFQNVIGILNEINKFNREITVESELRELSDGSTAEVTAAYLGIGQGYYIGQNGQIAGIGSATDEGWTWTPADDAAPQIADVIAILKNEKQAAFVRVPVAIK